MQWFFNMVHSHFTMFEGPSPHKMAFPTPMVWPLDDSQGSFHGHGPYAPFPLDFTKKPKVFPKNWVKLQQF